jgi:hypothetical protein
MCIKNRRLSVSQSKAKLKLQKPPALHRRKPESGKIAVKVITRARWWKAVNDGVRWQRVDLQRFRDYTTRLHPCPSAAPV